MPYEKILKYYNSPYKINILYDKIHPRQNKNQRLEKILINFWVL